jgi:hypothetical protein
MYGFINAKLVKFIREEVVASIIDEAEFPFAHPVALKLLYSLQYCYYV